MARQKTPVARDPNGRWKPGKSPNPGGRPRNRASIAYWLNEFASMTGTQAARAMTMYAREFRKAGDELPLAAMVAGRVLLALLNEPDARLLGHVLDRIDGKLVTTIQMNWREQAQAEGYDPSTIFEALVNAAAVAMAGASDSGSDTGSEEA